MSFSQKQFREALQQSSKVAQRFEKYLIECRKNNTEIIYYMVEEFLKIISDKESLLLKLNALFALTCCMETCEYVIVEMTEAFLLPALQEAALYHSDKRTYAKTSQFFKDKGYAPSTPNIQQLSHNYVTMATELVFLGAVIKPTCFFFTDRLNLPSAFRLLADRLKQKGLEAGAGVSGRAGELESAYQGNVMEFQGREEAYVQFFKKRLSRNLLQGGKGRDLLDIRKLLKNNDSWLTSEIIGSLNDALQDQNFTVRRHALNLLNDLFIWGDVEAIMVINQGQVVQRICERVMQVKGGSDLQKGTQIYPEIKGQLQQKKQFYVEFLRCLETWAILAPTAIYLNRDEESKVAKLIAALKQRSWVLPGNTQLGKQAKQFQQNMKRNQQRNNFIITQLTDGDTSKNRSAASHRLSKYSQKISLIREQRESTILSLPEIQRMVEEAEAALKVLPKVEREMGKNMKTLRYFNEEFQKKFCLIEEPVSQSRLEGLFGRGIRCTEKIAEIEPVYQDYLHGRVDFAKFGELLTARLSQVDHGKSKSRYSEVLSKLSKSKHSLSKDELSRSLHQAKNKEAYSKQDQVLEQSVDDHSMTQNNLTKTLNAQENASKLSQRSHKFAKHEQPSKFSHQQKPQPVQSDQKHRQPKMEKSQSRGSREEYKNSISLSQQESMNSTDKEKSPATAKFLLDEKSEHRKESSISQHNPNPQRKREEFSDNSEWSSSQEEEEQGPKQKEKIEEKPKPAPSQPQASKNKLADSKSRQVFSSSSFSHYDESNEQIREVIDKTENPDFKMLFKEKPADSHNSKLSKAHSQDHYAAVLESLVPKSSQQQEKSLSKLSRDKSTSQLPPRSHYDNNSSKIDNRNYLIAEEPSSQSLKEPSKKGSATVQQEGNSMDPPIDRQKSSLNHLKPKQSSLRPSGSVISNRQSNSHLSPPPSSLHLAPNNQSSITSEPHSTLSKARSEDRFKKQPSRVSEEGATAKQGKKIEGSELRLIQMKEEKLNEIRELEKRINFLKSEEKHLHELRSDWQSPARPTALRTALSPRFRNNNTSAQSNTSSDPSNPTNNNFHRRPRQRVEEMNFDVAELFKPPEGRLIYSRLYRKELQELDVRERRKVLKGKDLVLRNDEVEVGLMVHRDPRDLRIIYYVTPSKFIRTFLFKIDPNPKLSIHAIPAELSNLEPRKQYRIYLFAQVLQFPYRLPTIHFKYHPELLDIQEKLFLSNQVNHFSSLIPFFFTKFLLMRPATAEQLKEAWGNGSTVLRGQQTAYSRKLLPKHFYILQYFPDLINLETSQYQSSYVGECQYGSTKFLLKVVIKINKFLYIQGVLTSFRDRPNSQRIMEYTICCINHLLSKTHAHAQL